MAEILAALDLWTLLVHYVFGSFILAVLGIALVMAIIMGVLGRISAYSVQWYVGMFFLAMSLGSGYIILNVAITTSLIVAIIFSWKSYIGTR